MKKFIIISLLTAITLPSFACAWGEPENPYLFSMYRQDNFRTRVEKICNDGEFPLILGGDHSIALGSIAGVSAFASILGVDWSHEASIKVAVAAIATLRKMFFFIVFLLYFLISEISISPQYYYFILPFRRISLS